MKSNYKTRCYEFVLTKFEVLSVMLSIVGVFVTGCSCLNPVGTGFMCNAYNIPSDKAFCNTSQVENVNAFLASQGWKKTECADDKGKNPNKVCFSKMYQTVFITMELEHFFKGYDAYVSYKAVGKSFLFSTDACRFNAFMRSTFKAISRIVDQEDTFNFSPNADPMVWGFDMKYSLLTNSVKNAEKSRRK